MKERKKSENFIENILWILDCFNQHGNLEIVIIGKEHSPLERDECHLEKI